MILAFKNFNIHEIIRLLVVIVFMTLSNDVLSETIYQWTDQWGQVQYSKKPVPGSMVSELTEMPKTNVVTEQQKQDAMLRKMRQINNDNARLKNQANAQQLLLQQKRQSQKHCQALRTMLSDLRLGNIRRHPWNTYPLSRRYYYPGRPYIWDNYSHYRYDFLERDLHEQIRTYCR